MTATRVAVNGFGRIGRSFVRAALQRPGLVDVVAVNDTNDPEMLAYLLEYDTVQGTIVAPVELSGDELGVGPLVMALCRERDPARLPWDRLGIDVVVESTGQFTVAALAAEHLQAGARRVVISAPATGADFTACMGVNHTQYDPARHVIVSNASCTTNCLATMVHVLHSRFGIVDGFMSTVHAYTNDQNLLDLPHRGHTRDLRRARAAAQNIVPSSTGAAHAIGQVLPELDGRLEGIAFRVPVACGSVTDLVCTLEHSATRDDINGAFLPPRPRSRHGILDVTHRPLVSADIVGRPQSCIFSACDTIARGTRVKVLGWYDNEWGYANRLLELTALMGEAAPQTSRGATATA